MEGTSEAAVESERDRLVWVVWGLEGVGLHAGRGRKAGKRQGKLGEGPRGDETIQGRKPDEVRLVGEGSCRPSELLGLQKLCSIWELLQRVLTLSACN